MRLVSTLKMVNLNSDPAVFEDGEVYFNNLRKEVRMSYSGSWFSMIDTENLEISSARKVVPVNDGGGSFSYLILTSNQNAVLLAAADQDEVAEIIIPNQSTQNIDIGSTIKVVRVGDGAVQFIEESGVTLQAADENYLTARWTSVELIKYGENEWLVVGEFPDIY